MENVLKFLSRLQGVKEILFLYFSSVDDVYPAGNHMFTFNCQN